MSYKKMLYAIGPGEGLNERIRSALLIAKYFGAHLDIVKEEASTDEYLKIGYHAEELTQIVKNRDKEQYLKNENLVSQEAEKLGVIISNVSIKGTATARIISDTGSRSKFIGQESKYSDLILAASPLNGKITTVFETSITKSGKPILMFPRKMENFNIENILIGWNNSPEVSRAVSLAIPLLKKAKRVHIITSKEYTEDLINITKLQEYLRFHHIETTYEIVKTTLIPGEALLQKATEGNFDLIVAGAFGRKGFMELMLGGTTEHILKNTHIPVFMSH